MSRSTDVSVVLIESSDEDDGFRTTHRTGDVSVIVIDDSDNEEPQPLGTQEKVVCSTRGVSYCGQNYNNGGRSKDSLLSSVTNSVKQQINNCVHNITEGSNPAKRTKLDQAQEKPISKEEISEHTKKKRRRKDKRTRRDRRLAKARNKAAARARSSIEKPDVQLNDPKNEQLQLMKHIILVDFDNWKNLFDLNVILPEGTFVWGFHGPSDPLKSRESPMLKRLISKNCFYLHPQCGMSKDAADFALCCTAGRLDVQLPKNIPFTILSGDRGFEELQRQLSMSSRESHIVNPHNEELEMVISILNSIGEK